VHATDLIYFRGKVAVASVMRMVPHTRSDIAGGSAPLLVSIRYLDTSLMHDVGAAADADADAKAAAAKAWSLYKPDAVPTPRLVTAAPPAEGWSERAGIAYDTSPNERAVRSALALKQGQGWTVLIVDGAESTFNKRSAAAAIVHGVLRGWPVVGRVEATADGSDYRRFGPRLVKIDS
jgi:hypothetical protein